MGCSAGAGSIEDGGADTMGGPLVNSAFVFIKPHAVTEATKALVKATLEANGVRIVKEGDIKSEVIDEKKLIDQHYYAIASKATILKPDALNVPADKFKEKFGKEWAEVLKEKKAYNALDACKHLGLDEAGLDVEWKKSEAAGKLVKLGGGFYCGLIDTVAGKEPIYVFNAFFMVMRSKFTKPGESIHYYSVEFEPATLKWADFRGKVLGPTDPAAAPVESIRGQINAKWEELGLKSAPNVSDNGVHASASPFEGLAEKANWLGLAPSADPFASALLKAGVTAEQLKAWSVDPVVNYDGAGAKGSVFDKLEDSDVGPCTEKLIELAALNK